MLQAPPALQVLLLALALSLWLRLLVAVLSVLRLLAGVRMALLQAARLCPGCSSRPRCARCICVRRRSAIVDDILGRTVCACWLRVASFSWLEDPPFALAAVQHQILLSSKLVCCLHDACPPASVWSKCVHRARLAASALHSANTAAWGKALVAGAFFPTHQSM